MPSYPLQSGNNPAYTRLWSRIVGWNHTDPSIMSTDLEFHLQRARDGGYTYLHTRSGSELVRQEDCNLVLIGERDAPSSNINIALRKNSAFTQLFQEA